ncbi:MAG: redoxin domain-containing protein [Acidobacteria bacterium]|nr:redoxin domain-containing protein [Acidobacteriota bacterium]
MPHFDQNNSQVLGISIDTVPSQRNFAEKEGIKFPLLSDFYKKVSRTYGVLDEDKGYDNRTTLVVDKQGIIQRIDAGSQALSIAGAKEACGMLK